MNLFLGYDAGWALAHRTLVQLAWCAEAHPMQKKKLITRNMADCSLRS